MLVKFKPSTLTHNYVHANMYIPMKEISATSLRKSLFTVLKSVANLPTRIKYRNGDAVLISYEMYQKLKNKTQEKDSNILEPLIKGKIIKSITDDECKKELMDYMGLL